MSRDFIRQMPMAGDGIGYRQRVFNWFNLDPMLLCILLAIAGFGLLVLYSAADASEAVIRAQGVRLMAGFGLMLVIAQIPPYVLARITPVLYLFGLILLILTYPFGYEVNGSKRWLRIPGLINLQPSELMKVFLPMVMAWYLNERHLPPAAKPLTIGLGLMLLPFSLILLQPDLGTALLVASSGALVLLLAGLSWRFLFRLLLLVVAAAPAIWFLIRDYQRQRILTLFDPESDPLGAGWNIIQSKIAIGSGGLTGKGLFNGTQSVLAEELGFVGVVSLLSLYGLLMFRGLLISLQAQDTYGRLLAGSITFTFVVYVFVNIGMVSGILPVVGIPLPLVSYGGSSILTLFAGFGILMSIHSHRRINV